jgi:uncharacterized protein (TIGR01319 family)
MRAAVLADFGSTICKVTVVDLDQSTVAGHGEAPTFLGPDVMEGHDAAYQAAIAHLPRRPEVAVRRSCSSAGGGLRMAAVGLVEDMTAAAARRAALNAGGRLELVLHGQIDDGDLAALDACDPEIVLFSGGTDGGQRELVLANARALSGGSWSGQVVVACNREAAIAAAAAFRASGRAVHVVDNVMPEIGTVRPEAARSAILGVFLRHVIRGKNLSNRREFLESVTTATPEAALAATRLLAYGTQRVPGAGHVLVVDVGGATTDVHSVSTEPSATQGYQLPLLPPSQESRTVSGDLGMRSGAPGAVEADSIWLARRAGTTSAAWVKEGGRRAADPSWIAASPDELRREELLATSCVTHALTRHCGRQGWVHRPGETAPTLTMSGPDLRDVAVMVGTGGVIAHHSQPDRILKPALARAAEVCMSPASPGTVTDHDYVLAAAGLLLSLDADLAARVLSRALGLSSLPARPLTMASPAPSKGTA